MTGEVVYLFAFDIANELKLGAAQAGLGGRAEWYSPQGRHAKPRTVALHRPLSVTPPAIPVQIHTQAATLELRLYEFGAIGIMIRVRIDVSTLADLTGYLDPILANGQSLEHLARDLCVDICREIQPWLVRPSEPAEPESYTIFCIYGLDEGTDAEKWLTDHRKEAAGLLSSRPAALLSETQIDEVFRHRRSLERTDAVVIDWDAAIVIDLAGTIDDLLFTLELANLQLEEFRHMDRTLDRFMNDAYEVLERRSLFRFVRTMGMVKKLRWFRIDLARLADEVTNITKFFGDWHLARVYFAARERFHLDRWKESVAHRLAELDQLYNLLHAETSERRMLLLEVTVVVLFVIEVMSTLKLWSP